YISSPAVRSDITSRGVAKRHGGVSVLLFLTQHRSHGFANDVAPSEHDDFGARRAHARPRQKLANSRWCARKKPRRISQHQLADVYRMKTVHIFLWKHARINHGLPDL